MVDGRADARLAERLCGPPARVDFDGAASYVFVSGQTRRHAAAQGLAEAAGRAPVSSAAR